MIQHHPNSHNYASPLPSCQTPLSVLYVTTTAVIGSADQALGNKYSNYLHMYVHGRYPVALHLDINDGTANQSNSMVRSMVASADLTHILITGHNHYNGTNACLGQSSSSSMLTLYSIPGLSMNRYTFQQIATFYSKITTHLHAIRNNLPAVTASYKSSLKPLDLKLDSLYTLLQNYGLTSSNSKPLKNDEDENDDPTLTSATSPVKGINMRTLLVQYILSGHTRISPNLSNAIDQFFTSAQMNDQLLVRMERSLLAAVSNVEKAFKQTLLAPSIALYYAVDMLHGLAKYRTDIFPFTSKPGGSIHDLVLFTELLVVSMETALTELIEARFRLRDFVSWLRSSGSQIKARGTAKKSVQRENAKKRRVPDSVIRRMLSYLRQQHEEETASVQTMEDSNCGTTETLLALKFSSFLKSTTEFIKTDSSPSDQQRLFSEGSNVSTDLKNPDKMATTSLIRTTPTIPRALEKTIHSAEAVFEHPRLFLSKSITRTMLQIRDNHDAAVDGPEAKHPRILAITTRLGLGNINQVLYYGETKPNGFFCPKTIADASSSSSKEQAPVVAELFRQWAVLAKAADHCPNILTLHTFPLTWINTRDNDDDIFGEDSVDDHDDDEDFTRKTKNKFSRDTGMAARFQWTCTLAFPSDCKIVDVAFYGDDGKSSLLSSSGEVDHTSNGAGTGLEGRQALGVLVARCDVNDVVDVNKDDEPNNLNTTSAASKLELWLLSYDSLPYHCLPIVAEKYGGENEDCVRQVLSNSSVTSNHVIVHAMKEDDNEEEDDTGVNDFIVAAKTRVLSMPLTGEGYCRLVLSGSRGIGAIFSGQHKQGGTSLELLDLEEDEENESEEMKDVEDDEQGDDDNMDADKAD